jgi:hypothetical protein
MYMLKTMITICSALLALVAVAPLTWAATAPDTIEINSLTSLYNGVKFNHAKHITYQRDCAVCHHHTNGAPATDSRCVKCHRGGHEAATMACKGCHVKEPFSAAGLQNQFSDPQRYHQDKPGLKVAFHLSCMGCHAKQGGPTGCLDCHTQTDMGNAMYRSGPNAPKKTAKSGNGGH